MDTNNKERDFNKQSFYGPQQDALIVGGLWVVCFGCFIGSLSVNILSFVAIASFLYACYIILSRAFGYFKTYGPDRFTWFADYRYMINTCFFASIILALAVFVYFQLLDHGYVAQSIDKNIQLIINTPELASQLEAVYGKDMLNMVKAERNNIVDSICAIRPVEMAYQIAMSYLMLHILLCIPFAIGHSIFKNRLNKNN